MFGYLVPPDLAAENSFCLRKAMWFAESFLEQYLLYASTSPPPGGLSVLSIFTFFYFLNKEKKRWFRLNHHLANLMNVWCIDNLRDWLLSFVTVEKVTLWDWILCYLMCPQTMTQHFKQFCWAVFPHFAVLAHSCWCWATSFLRGSRQMFISHQIRAHRTSYVVVLQHWWKKKKESVIIGNYK